MSTLHRFHNNWYILQLYLFYQYLFFYFGVLCNCKPFVYTGPDDIGDFCSEKRKDQIYVDVGHAHDHWCHITSSISILIYSFCW